MDFVDAAVADVIGIEMEHVNFAAEYGTAYSPSLCANTRPGVRPIPTSCATPKSSSRPSDHAMRLGAEKIATGHYARVRFNASTGLHELLKGLDPSKDQSYFLHRLNQAQLAKTLFPVGEILKTEVRRIATEVGLPNARKKDSTGICFIGERPFREFLNRYIQRSLDRFATVPNRSVAAPMVASSDSTWAFRFTHWVSARAWGLAASNPGALRKAAASISPGLWRAKTWTAIRCGWCRVMRASLAAVHHSSSTGC